MVKKVANRELWKKNISDSRRFFIIPFLAVLKKVVKTSFFHNFFQHHENVVKKGLFFITIRGREKGRENDIWRRGNCFRQLFHYWYILNKTFLPQTPQTSSDGRPLGVPGGSMCMRSARSALATMRPAGSRRAALVTLMSRHLSWFGFFFFRDLRFRDHQLWGTGPWKRSWKKVVKKYPDS